MAKEPTYSDETPPHGAPYGKTWVRDPKTGKLSLVDNADLEPKEPGK